MPTYSFECLECQKKFDEFTSIGKQNGIVCPECGGEVKRIYDGKCLVSARAGKNCAGDCNGCAGCSGH